MIEDSLKLTAYFGERQRIDGRFFADVLLDLCARHEIATSLLLRGVEGFGLKHHLRTDRLLTLSEDLPLSRSPSTATSASTRWSTTCSRCNTGAW